MAPSHDVETFLATGVEVLAVDYYKVKDGQCNTCMQTEDTAPVDGTDAGISGGGKDWSMLA